MNHFMLDGSYKSVLTMVHLDAAEVLRRAGLPEDILNHRTITMGEEEYYRFIQAMGDSLGSEAPLIDLAASKQIETFSPPIFAAWCSRDGEACIERLATYKKLVGPMSWRIEKSDVRLTVIMEAGDSGLSLPSLLVQSDFAFLLGMLRRGTKYNMVPWKLELTAFPRSPSLADLAGIPLQKGKCNAITFRRADLKKPFVSFNPAMWSYFEPEMNRRLSELQADDSMSARVRSALAAVLPGGAYTIDDVAHKLGISKRTLQRKLGEEHTAFQKQLSSTRETLAIHYICHTDMGNSDIAFLLGYAELNSFLRAFPVWTGKSVSQYRKSHRNVPSARPIDHP